MKVAREAGDNASRELFERLLKDEGRARGLSRGPDPSDQGAGLGERYLSQQIEETEAK